MTTNPAVYRLVSALTCSVVLTGCSADTILWGPTGAQVVITTDELSTMLAAGSTPDIACADAIADFSSPEDWVGLSAGEPEPFNPQYWPSQQDLRPEWNINLEGLPPSAESGDRIPGDVFYRETAEGLCVVDIAWATLISVD